MPLKTLLEWVEVAKNLGYEGKAAVKFAETERNLEKDRAESERNAQRELNKIAAEAETNLAKIATDKEIQIAKIQMTANHDDALSAGSNAPSDRLNPIYNRPQLPKFD